MVRPVDRPAQQTATPSAKKQPLAKSAERATQAVKLPMQALSNFFQKL